MGTVRVLVTSVRVCIRFSRMWDMTNSKYFRSIVFHVFVYACIGTGGSHVSKTASPSIAHNHKHNAQTTNEPTNNNNHRCLRHRSIFRIWLNIYAEINTNTYLTLLWSMPCWRRRFRSWLLHGDHWYRRCGDIFVVNFLLIRIVHIVIINTVIVIVIVVCIRGDGISMANVVYNNTFGGGGCRRTGTVNAHICCPIAIGGHCDCTCTSAQWKFVEDREIDREREREE